MRAAIAKSPAPAIASTDWTVALERGGRGCDCSTACVPGGAGGAAGAFADDPVASWGVDTEAAPAAMSEADTRGARLSTASRARSARAAEVDASHSSVP